MNSVTVRNDSGVPQSTHPWGSPSSIPAGASVTVDTDAINPLETKSLKALDLTVTAGAFPSDADITKQIQSFSFRDARNQDERTAINIIAAFGSPGGPPFPVPPLVN